MAALIMPASKLSPDKVQAIGERLAGGEPLAAICRDIGICDDTVRNWMAKDKELSRDIARAREDGESAIAHRLRLTARGQGDSSGDVQRDKLIVDTDLKLLAKFNPKRWGDKVETVHSGELVHKVERSIVRP